MDGKTMASRKEVGNKDVRGGKLKELRQDEGKRRRMDR